MMPPSQSVEVRFHGAFLTHPHWKLNTAGSLMINAALSELTIRGEQGRGLQRTPHALKLPTKFVVNVLADEERLQFQVRDRHENVADDVFILEFDSTSDARLFAELLPKVWVHPDAPVGATLRRPQARWWQPLTEGPALVMVLGTVGFVLPFSLAWHGSEGIDPAMVQVAHAWGNHGAATRNGEAWRLVTHLFASANPADYLLQMVGLWWWGSRVHRLLGPLVWWTTLILAGLAGGVASILWHEPDNWTTGVGGALQGLIGATWVTLWLWGRAGRKLSRPLIRDLLVFQLSVVIAELLLSGPDWGQLVGGLTGGLLVGWLSWRKPDAKEQLPPRIGRAALASLVLLPAAWWLSPDFGYRPAEEAALDAWEERYTPEASVRERAFVSIEGDFSRGQTEISPVLFEANRLALFYRQRLAELRELDLTEGLRSGERRQTLVADLEKKRLAAVEATQTYREMQALRVLGLRHEQQLRNLSPETTPEAYLRQLDAARAAVNSTELKTDRARAEREKLLVEWSGREERARAALRRE